MTKSSVKPSLERIEGKLDSISQRLCSMSQDCESDEIETDATQEAKSKESQEE